MYSAKNYTEQGGEVTHIGGKLIIEKGATVEGFEGGGSYSLPIAGPSTLGGVKAAAKSTATVPVEVDTDGTLYVPGITPGVHVANAASEAPTAEEFNALVAALQNAGFLAAE